MNRTIEYILTVAECGGITKAANLLYITPSALSKFVIQKENELGVKLFHRDGNRFVLTYAGERYIELLKEMRELEIKTEMEMRRLADMYAGRFRLGFQQFFAESVITSIAVAMKQDKPSIHISLEETNYQSLVRMLGKKQIDAALLLTDEYSSFEGMTFKEIIKTPVVLAFAKGTVPEEVCQNREGFSFPWLPDEYIKTRKLVPDEGGTMFSRYAGYLLNNADPIKRSSVTVRTAKTALHCVANNIGIAAIPFFQISELRLDSEVDCFSFGEMERSVSFGILYDEKTMQDEEIVLLETVIRKYLESCGFIN